MREPRNAPAVDDVGTRPVDDADRSELIGELLAGVREFSMVMTEMMAAASDAQIVSNTELITVIVIDLDGPQRHRSLVARTGLTTGGTTNLLDRLEQGGLVSRLRDPDGDGRGVLVELTSDGTEMVDRTARAVSRAFALADPLIARWAEIFTALGYDVGAFRFAHASRRANLSHILRLSELGEQLQTTWRGVFGAENPTPSRSFHVLWLARRAEGARPTHLARANRVSAAAMSETLARLEADGFIVRARGETDRRAVIVSATPAGRAALQRAIDVAGRALEPLAAELFPS